LPGTDAHRKRMNDIPKIQEQFTPHDTKHLDKEKLSGVSRKRDKGYELPTAKTVRSLRSVCILGGLRSGDQPEIGGEKKLDVTMWL